MIFLDTGFVFALLCKQDASHERVRAEMVSLRGRTEALSVDEDFTHRFIAWPGPPPRR